MINAFTPGPGNILALNTVTNYGWKKGRPLFFGIFTGYYVVQLICAVFVFGIAAFLPSVLGVMKYIGAAYILWLAIHIAISKPEKDDDSRSASYMKGFLLQFVNVKIYLFGMTALTGYITDYYTSLTALVIAELFIATLGMFRNAHIDRNGGADTEILPEALSHRQHSAGTHACNRADEVYSDAI